MMALPPLLFETIVSPIEQAGDYFIMDSDPLISHPYLDMQKTNVDDSLRRVSLSERMTSVQNAICNNHFNMAKGKLEKEQNMSLRELHETSSKLRHHVKLLDLDRRRNTVEINKRLQPTKDYSYDDQQLETSQQRLGVTGPCYYLKKSFKYPVRHSGLQETVTPTLAKARKTLQQYKFELFSSGSPELGSHKTLSRESKSRSSARSERASKMLSVQSNGPLSESTERLYTGETDPVKRWAFLTQSADGNHNDNPYNKAYRIRANTLPNISKSTGSLDATSSRAPSGHKVKFMFPVDENKNYARLDAHIFRRSNTFHEGVTNKAVKSCYLLDSDDEEPPPRKVDLRELLYGKSTIRTSTQGSSMSQRKRSTYNAPGHLTQEMVEKEATVIKRKVKAFLNNVESWDPALQVDSDSSSDNEEYRRPSPIVPRAHVTAFSRHFLSVMEEEEKDREQKEQQRYEKNKTEDKDNDVEYEDNMDDNDGNQNKGDDSERKKIDVREKAIAKWQDTAWRATQPDSKLRKMSTDDLILEKIMGINITKGSRKIHGVPVNSAGRALRHTPTFKMQKVVEALISGRTKYQQYEVENIKKKLDSGVDISKLEENTDEVKDRLKASFQAVTIDDSISEVTEEGSVDLQNEKQASAITEQQYYAGNIA